MDGRRFDEFVVSCATSRRGVMRALVGVIAASAGAAFGGSVEAARCAGDDDCPDCQQCTQGRCRPKPSGSQCLVLNECGSCRGGHCRPDSHRCEHCEHCSADLTCVSRCHGDDVCCEGSCRAQEDCCPKPHERCEDGTCCEGACKPDGICCHGPLCLGNGHFDDPLCCPPGSGCFQDDAGNPTCCPPERSCKGQCCPEGEICAGLDGLACCPLKQFCGDDLCCSSGFTCVDKDQHLCCADEFMCNGSCCMGSGKACIGGQCQDCPPERACDDLCCPEGTVCLTTTSDNQQIKICCPPTNAVCNGTCCPAGQHCCNGVCQDSCDECAAGEVFCDLTSNSYGNTACCPAGSQCCPGNKLWYCGPDPQTGLCCQAGETDCYTKCCGPGLICSVSRVYGVDGEVATCCPDGQEPCGGGCCDPGVPCRTRDNREVCGG